MTDASTTQLSKTQLPSREILSSARVNVIKKLNSGRWVTHSSYTIFLLLITWLNFQSPDNGFALWFFKMFPLIIFIPGFIKKYYRTYSWLCFAILPYFIWLVPLVIGRGTWNDWVLVILTVIIFISSMMTSRWFQQESYLGWQIANTPTAV